MATPPNQMGLTGPVQANDIVMRASEIGTTIPGIASLAMKSARKGAQRGVQGIYQLPSGNEPTPEFMNVSQQNLNNQLTQMASTVEAASAPPNHMLAFITPDEAGILKLLGGTGEITSAGIPAFPPQGQYGAGGGGTHSSPSEGAGGSDRPRDPSNPEGTSNVDSGTTSPDLGGKEDKEDKEDGSKKDYTGQMPKGFVEEEGEDEATAKAVETAKKNKAIMDANAAITAGKGFLTDSSGGLVSAGGAMAKAEEDRVREAYMQKAIDDAKSYAKSGLSRDAAYGLSGLSEFGNEGMGLQTATVGQGLDNLGDRLGELTAKAKANTISNIELDEMAQLNEFYGKNPTTGMGLTESLRYQFTNQQFKDDLTKAVPVLGAAALVGFAPGIVKSIMGINNLMKMFSEKPSTSLRTTIENQLKKLTGKEKKALAKTLPSNYKGFGIQGEDRGQGGDRRAQEEAKRRAAEEEARRRAEEEAENNRERDRFERSFANRYFVGPASLDEVRKYAITDGGYSQLTPFYGREKETV
jgi:hypothetical protein